MKAPPPPTEPATETGNPSDAPPGSPSTPFGFNRALAWLRQSSERLLRWLFSWVRGEVPAAPDETTGEWLYRLLNRVLMAVFGEFVPGIPMHGWGRA